MKQNWLSNKNIKLFLILYEKEKPNWPTAAHTCTTRAAARWCGPREVGPLARRPTARESHARWQFSKRGLTLLPNHN